VGVDIDADALAISRANLDELGVEDMTELVCADVTAARRPWRAGLFDTVVMNPPFGTKAHRGADVAFLRVGWEVRWRRVGGAVRARSRDRWLMGACS
jgi:rRNA N6-adenosine-methyltransferase METTL5